MQSAVYYPHSSIDDSPLLRTALLLWDELTFIVPNEAAPLHAARRIGSSVETINLVDEALELIGRKHTPTIEEQNDVHDAIEDLVTSADASKYLLDGVANGEHYYIYEEKLSSQTWQMMRAQNLAVPDHQGMFHDWVTNKNLGVALMALLAKIYAGKEKRVVTDTSTGHDVLVNSMAKIQQKTENVEGLMSMVLQCFNSHEVRLKDALQFRKMESRNAELTNMRRNLLKLLTETSSEIGMAENEHDQTELLRQFKSKIELDRRVLKGELGDNLVNSLFSKETLVYFISTALVPATAGASMIPAGMGLFTNMVNHRKKRQEILNRHPSSWVFTFATKQNRQPESLSMLL